MEFSSTRRILNVFLASPNDVAEERAIAEDLVADINKTIGRRLGWNVDLNKWEDTSPGFGRPQAKITQATQEVLRIFRESHPLFANVGLMPGGPCIISLEKPTTLGENPAPR
jgi:hypothetical protein